MRISPRRSVVRPLLLCGLALVAAGCGRGANPAASRPSAGDKKVADGLDPSIRISEEEAEQFAQQYAAAINALDADGARGMFDWDEMIRRSAEGLELDAQSVADFGSGVKSTAPAQLYQELTNVVAEGGRYQVMHIRLGRGGRRVMFRMATHDGYINYHDIVLYRAPGDQVLAADMYVAATGELMSETLRRALVQMAAHENRTLIQRLTGSQADLVKHRAKVVEYMTHARNKRPQEALAAYWRLPPSLQRDKTMLIVRIAAAKEVSGEEMAAAVDDLLKHYADDPCAALFMIDAEQRKGNLSGVLSAIDKLDKSVGGDPYLDVMRANVHVEHKNPLQAKELLAKVEAWDPTLPETQWAYISMALEDRDFDEVVRRLRKVTEEFGMELNDLNTIPEYAEFLKSPQYAEWNASRAAAN